MNITEPNDRIVSTPRVTSRTEAWKAFEASLLAKYSKIRKKIQKTADKRQAEFNDMIEDPRYKLWMFVHATRWRRGEVQVEPVDGNGELVWVQLTDYNSCHAGKIRMYYQFSPFGKYRVSPEYEFYRNRQAHILDNKEDFVSALRDGDWLFKEEFYRFEMSDEQIAESERLEEEARMQWIIDQGKKAQERRDAVENHARQKVDEYATNFKGIVPHELREVLSQCQPMYRYLYLISQYKSVNMTTLELLVNTLGVMDRDLTQHRALDLVAKYFGYNDFPSSKHLIENGRLDNLRYTEE